MREQSHSTDYNHIRIYGTMQGWAPDFIKGQQQLAYMLNAPYDTIEIVNDKALRFCNMSSEFRREFVKFQNKDA